MFHYIDVGFAGTKLQLYQNFLKVGSNLELVEHHAGQ